MSRRANPALIASLLIAGAAPARAQLSAEWGWGGMSAHQRALIEHADVPTRRELLEGPEAPTLRTARPCASVVGFLPYWASSAGVRWDLLTHVACFGIEIASDGSVTALRGWPWTSTITTARNNDVKVLLSVINFDPAALKTLLTSASNRQALIATLKTQTLNRADGVMLDFEGSTSNGWTANLASFVSDLRAGLRTQDPDAEVWLATPAVNWNFGWDLNTLSQQADGLFVMGYDFYGSFSSTSGPSSPLTGGAYNLTNTVTAQYASVVRPRPNKVVLGVPWYGNQWRTATGSAYATASGFVSSQTYAGAAAQAGTYGRRWDTTSQTPWTAWQSAGQWNQTWYDDPESLGLKFDLAITHKLGGVGMWALGYQGSGDDLWSPIQDRFVDACPCAADVTGDNVVDLADFFQFLNDFDQTLPAADVDDSGEVDLGDFFLFMNLFDGGCS